MANLLPRQPGAATVAFVSLGCPKNLVDSERMLGLLAAEGLLLTADHDAADAIVINTCGFLEASRREALEKIRQAIHSKNQAQHRGRRQRVVVAGCLVQRDKTRLLADAPGIDALVGVFDRENIVQAVRGDDLPRPEPALDMGSFHALTGSTKSPAPTLPAAKARGPELTELSAVTTLIQPPNRSQTGYTEDDSARLRLTPRHYAYLRISEGCNQGCTFCTIPSIRGRMRSKPLATIIREAQELSEDGALEINLIGQDTTSYGHDIGYDGPGQGLVGLLAALDKIPLVRWFRLMYAYPSCFTDDMIRALAAAEKVVKYIDIPLQHINDDILYAMRRKVTRRQIETLLGKLRRWIPDLAIRTTFISGFPGETEAQHRQLIAFVRDFSFDCLGVFEYSPEPETPAGRVWRTQGVPAEVAARRREEIMLAQQEIAFRKNAALVDREFTVLVDQANAQRRTAMARHAGQAPDIDGRVLLRQCSSAAGEWMRVVIRGAQGYDLIAHPARSGPAAVRSLQRPVRLPVLA